MILASLAGAGVSVFVFALYLRTLAPTVLYYDLPVLRDAAVLQTKAAILGVPDYTGYPIYVMLGKLFTYLPFGDTAYRVNLASAVYAALAVRVVYLIGERLTGRVVAAAGGALAFGVSRVFWSQAVIAEVYTLNALFVALTIFVLLVWRTRRRDGYLLLAALLMGLSLTHHLTSGLLLPAGVIFVWLVERSKLLERRLILKGAGMFLVGLLPYAYLPIRASMDYLPQGWVWGQPGIQRHLPNTPYGFFNLVSGGGWKDRMWAFGPEELPARFNLYLDYLFGQNGQFHLALVFVAMLGAFHLVRQDRTAAALLGFLFVGWLFHALEYDIEDIEYYFISTYLILAVFVAAGFAALLGGLESMVDEWPGPAGRLVLAVLCVLAVALPLYGLWDTYAEVDRSGDYHGRKIIETVAQQTKPGATILHHRSPLSYMVLVEQRRKDLSLLGYLEDPGPPAVIKVLRAMEQGPVYILFPGKETTIYYLGVEDATRMYRNVGLELNAVNEETLLYEFIEKESVIPDRTDGWGVLGGWVHESRLRRRGRQPVESPRSPDADGLQAYSEPALSWGGRSVASGPNRRPKSLAAADRPGSCP